MGTCGHPPHRLSYAASDHSHRYCSGKGGWCLPRIKFPFKFGLGGPIGSGDQNFPWIHLDDLLSLFTYAIKHEVSGVYDGVAPQQVTQAEFAKTLGKIAHRPAICPTPAFLLKLMLGERGKVLLEGASLDPTYPEGFSFKHPKLKEGLYDLW